MPSIRRCSLWLSIALLAGSLLHAAVVKSAAAEENVAGISKVRVVVSSSILGDMVRQIAQDRAQIITLVPPNADAHVYQPTPADAQRVGSAQLLVYNGLGFDNWMERLREASDHQGPVVLASSNISFSEREEDPQHDAHDARDAHEAQETLLHDEHRPDIHNEDHHVWQNVAYARVYVRDILDGLVRSAPGHASFYRANAARYLQQLDALESEIRQAIASIPPERRVVVVPHAAFSHFSRAYGIEFHAVVGHGAKRQASAAEMATITRKLREGNISAIFAENIADRRLIEQIARETDVPIGGTLYSDALSGVDGPAATYVDMMRHNLRTLIAALKTDVHASEGR